MQQAALPAAVSIQGLEKAYASGLYALKDIDLESRAGGAFALLGPVGAGKTTWTNIGCGSANASAGTVLAGGHDTVREARGARALAGLGPQELSTDSFERVWATVR